ncbi:MAG: hypothetical protein AB1405_02680 [Bdellovibrionota bacterium]
MSFARNQQTAAFLEQWERVLRWQGRVHGRSHASPDEFMDHLYALFQNCFAMRDWLENSEVIPGESLSEIFSAFELRLCRDICNGTKHLEITRPSVDANFMTVREYAPPPISKLDEALSSPEYKLVLIAADNKYDLVELADQCVDILRNALSTRNLLSQKSNLKPLKF